MISQIPAIEKAPNFGAFSKYSAYRSSSMEVLMMTIILCLIKLRLSDGEDE